jgi:hypothetical protein
LARGKRTGAKFIDCTSITAVVSIYCSFTWPKVALKLN